MKLLALIVSGSSFGITGSTILGVELETWENSLVDQDVFITIENNGIIPTDYADVSNITNWDRFGSNVKFDYSEVRQELIDILPPSYSGLTTEELLVLDKYILNPYLIIYNFLNYESVSLEKTLNPRLISLDGDLTIKTAKEFFYNTGGTITGITYYEKFSGGTFINELVKDIVVSGITMSGITNAIVERFYITSEGNIYSESNFLQLDLIESTTSITLFENGKLTDAISIPNSGVVSKTSFDSYSGITELRLKFLENVADFLSGYTANTATKKIVLISTGNTDVNQITPVVLDFHIIERIENDYFSFTGNNTIVINQTAKYTISYHIPIISNTGGFTRRVISSIITVSGTTNINRTLSNGYIAGSGNESSVELPQIELDLTQGDLVQLIAYRNGGTGIVNIIPNSVFIEIEKVI